MMTPFADGAVALAAAAAGTALRLLPRVLALLLTAHTSVGPSRRSRRENGGEVHRPSRPGSTPQQSLTVDAFCLGHQAYLNSISGPPLRTDDRLVPEPVHISEQSGVPQHELKQHCPAGQDVPLHGWNDEQNPSRRSMHVQVLGSAALQKQPPLPLHPLQGITTSQHVFGSQPHDGQPHSPTGWHLFAPPVPIVQSHLQPPPRARHLACCFACLHFLVPHTVLSVPADTADVKTGAKYTAPATVAARISRVCRSIRSASVIRPT
jgi:hypothetical protein